MQLTPRQEEFVRNLLDLYTESRGPIHYSALAERLSVSPITAYDMLRLLEARGYVRSDYRLEKAKRGPGRSTVVFVPTDKAHRVVARFGSGIQEPNWERVKDAMLDEIRSGRSEEHELAVDMLAHAPQDDVDSVRYATEVATVLVLRLWRHGDRLRAREYLEAFLYGTVDARRERLLLLTGFAAGLLAGQDGGHGDTADGIDEVLAHVDRYLAYVDDMDDEARRRLAANLERTLSPLLAREREGARPASRRVDGPSETGGDLA